CKIHFRSKRNQESDGECRWIWGECGKCFAVPCLRWVRGRPEALLFILGYRLLSIAWAINPFRLPTKMLGSTFPYPREGAKKSDILIKWFRSLRFNLQAPSP